MTDARGALPGIQRLPAHRSKVEAARAAVQRRDDVLGLAVGGSLAARIADRLSDVDLKIVVEAERLAEVAAWRDRELVAACGRAVARFTGEHVGLPELLIVLYDDLVHVDLQLVRLDEVGARLGGLPHAVVWERDERVGRALAAGGPGPRPVDLRWCEDRMWTWLWYTHAKVLRGEVYEALDALAYMRARVLFALLALSRGAPPAGARRIEALLGGLADAFAATAPRPVPAEVMEAVRATEELYTRLADPLLEEAGIARADEARAVVRGALAQGLGWTPSWEPSTGG